MYVLICPICGETDDISNIGNTFLCNECCSAMELEEMDFKYLDF